ncbi:hypothetical protein H2200_009741 [Cladophialophora chaetospira]|uniref:F-box domain-containing protein n=1 Tax=Cladophialophora chaetospira TaxID=386627 RepID=A0AA38X342_9EURO|nr:hypothetical protein H2200_009741 [Cladophialophora chaetospira]
MEPPPIQSALGALDSLSISEEDVPTTILDLPPEVLVHCASYLSGGDIKHILEASKYLYEALRSEVFRNLEWRFGTPTVQWPRRYPPGSILSRNAHALAERMLDGSFPVENLCCVSIHWSNCRACLLEERATADSSRRGPPFAPRCNLVTTSIFEQMTKLVTLRLWGNADPLPKGLPMLPNLRSLTLGKGYLIHGWHYAVGTLDYQDLRAQLKQPRLERIEIVSLEICETDTTESFGNLEKIQSSTVTHVVLENAQVSGRTLKDFFRRLSTLQSLTLRRRQPDFETATSSSSMAEIYEAIKTVSGTLENLSLTHFYPNDWGWALDDTLLGSLVGFSKLKRLVIDPSMLFGCSICPSMELPESLLELRQSLASDLPESIERLWLVIDLDQAKRLERYREEILQGLWDQRNRLRTIRQITFVETLGFQQRGGRKNCNCQDYDQGCYSWDMYGARHLRMKASTAREFWKMVSMFSEDAGINIKLLEFEDVEIRRDTEMAYF